jgi:hypothetical protein
MSAIVPCPGLEAHLVPKVEEKLEMHYATNQKVADSIPDEVIL